MLDLKLIACAALLTALSAASAAELLHTDSPTPYVHRISLYDEDGEVISPEDEPAKPFDQLTTCGKCHPCAHVGRGWHFNAADPNVEPGRPGEPWIWLDLRTRTQLPLSERGWPGAFKPADVGLTRWRFVQVFGSHMPGGGSEKQIDPNARWRISGQLTIACMACHSAAPSYDVGERASQLARQNFKWAAVAANGLAVVRGDASKLPNDYDPMLGLSPDAQGPQPPTVQYDASLFDANERVFFNIGKRPTAERCCFCHANRLVGSRAPEPWQTDRDVHLAAGLTCTDCHRNGLDHAIVRGFERETPTGTMTASAVASLSCRGCHLGSGQAKAGRLGAPRPEHNGLPALHLDKLSCTTCHSGPWPANAPCRVQTARAHRLGLATKRRSTDAPPYIVEPVFVKQTDGRIGPHRMMWPAFWGRLERGKVAPIAPDEVSRVAGRLLGPKKLDKHAPWTPLTDEQIAGVLGKLARNGAGEAVYVCGGQLYQLKADGKLAARQDDAAKPYAWPLAHNVRPAAQSLGSGGCEDCHSEGAGFFFGQVTPGPLPAAKAKPMHEFMGCDPSLLRRWVLLVRLRTPIIWISLIAGAVIAATLIRYGFQAIEGLGKRLR